MVVSAIIAVAVAEPVVVGVVPADGMVGAASGGGTYCAGREAMLVAAPEV